MSTLHTDLSAYYSSRAATCDNVYAQPDRQEEFALLRERVGALVQGQNVLELACGSGYWTAVLAESAHVVLATDNNPLMLEAAQTRDLPRQKVQLAQIDAFELDLASGLASNYSVCFAGFFWAHVRREQQTELLARVRQAIGKDGLLILIDDNYLEEDTAPVARTDAEGNTYQIETLADGERYEYVKNFPSDSALRKKFSGVARDIRILRLQHSWMLSCRLK
ncbi:trans-aconitate 2-methyltransferase [Herminiimonas sp. CN]|uniref:class I SAM-dependent methyltransferase n=1 Tax=Herminiimonas sp. CN TaxID=1349818 RepID=UPI0009DE085F|nr:methyltransferase domain-containing protein [Herminiimonas sp. CN]